ncbi:MAG: GTPase ObgE, partial [Pararhodobacter sp.]
DCTQDDPAKAYRTIRAELEAYDPDFADRPEIVALNKIDALTPELVKEQAKQLKKAYKGKPLLLSGVTGAGVKDALYLIAAHLGMKDEDAPVTVSTGDDDDPDTDSSWSPV